MSITSVRYSHIYFSTDDLDMPHSDCIPSSVLFVYTRRRGCPDKAVQVYFGSMNYAAYIYITSNYHIVIRLVFAFARTTCARQTFSGKVDCNI